MHMRLSFRSHLALLTLFLASLVLLWMLPALLVGYPYTASEIIHQAQAFGASRVLEDGVAPLSVLSVWALHPLIGWENILGWSAVTCVFSALALFFWWLCAHRLFDARIAWLSTILLGLMPLYWVEAVRMGGYPLAFLLLFASFWCFLMLFPRHRIPAVLSSSFFFGLVLAVEHTFLTFLPFFLLAYLWHRRASLRWALLECALFCGVAYAAFMLPLLPNAFQNGLTPLQRAAVFLPPISSNYTGIMHLYPDEYAFTFLKPEFDDIIRRQAEQASFLEEQQDQNLLINFGIGDVSLLGRFWNGVWLFLNALPALVFPETMGGAFLWLFILPGMAVLFRQRRTLFLHLTGLWLTMEFLIRFVLHFVRIHVMDVGWILALFAAVGIVEAASVLHARWKHPPLTILMALIVLFTGLQLVQVNRAGFARLYARSNVPRSYAVRDALLQIPSDAVLAHPRQVIASLFFSPRKTVVLHDSTVDLLAEKGQLGKPFDYYHVTHIFGYDAERTALITKAMPGIRVVEVPSDTPPVAITPLLRYLLHQFR